jgi:hypothetical protein
MDKEGAVSHFSPILQYYELRIRNDYELYDYIMPDALILLHLFYYIEL